MCIAKLSDRLIDIRKQFYWERRKTLRTTGAESVSIEFL